MLCSTSNSHSSSAQEIIIDDGGRKEKNDFLEVEKHQSVHPAAFLSHGDPPKKDLTQQYICSDQYRPRMVSIPTVVDLTRKEDVSRRLSDQRNKKHVVIDYKSLRKSGYFLEKHRVADNNELPNLEPGNKLINTREATKQWIKFLPETHSDYSTDEERKYPKVDGLTREYLLNRYANQEEHIKRFILRDENNNFNLPSTEQSFFFLTSEPAPVLTFKQIEVILKDANEKLDDILANTNKKQSTSRIYQEHQYDYVYGTVAFPESWRKEEPSENASLKKSSGVIEWIKSFFSYFRKSSSKSTEKIKEQKQDVSQEETIGQLILEPYKGPTFINGAVIKAGAEKISHSGNLVEEVKFFLKAIHRALYGDSPQMLKFPKKKTLKSPPMTNEDAEIKRLTELLQKAKLKKKNKKSHPRTVFAIKNVEPIPILTTRRGRLRQFALARAAARPNQNQNMLSRVINRMIRRRFQSGSQQQQRQIRQRYRIVNNRITPRESRRSATFSTPRIPGILNLIAPLPMPTPGIPLFCNFPRHCNASPDNPMEINLSSQRNRSLTPVGDDTTIFLSRFGGDRSRKMRKKKDGSRKDEKNTLRPGP